jgi:hypothetical protein
LGEIGDGTDALIAYLDEQTARPSRQLVFSTDARLDMTAFPQPAYDRIDLRNYFLGSVQFSSGCPYLCEFCDIPALYGRDPRLKDPEQIGLSSMPCWRAAPAAASISSTTTSSPTRRPPCGCCRI